ncbi:hypothetical protein H4582DRAFT_2064641 [Lactarius indigo]|nr:hypothetical protein H4582DRAFT_2064641 [Lactarius indigo]
MGTSNPPKGPDVTFQSVRDPQVRTMPGKRVKRARWGWWYWTGYLYQYIEGWREQSWGCGYARLHQMGSPSVVALPSAVEGVERDAAIASPLESPDDLGQLAMQSERPLGQVTRGKTARAGFGKPKDPKGNWGVGWSQVHAGLDYGGYGMRSRGKRARR